MANAAPQSPTPQEIWAILRDIAEQLRSTSKTVQAQLLAEQSRLRSLYAVQRGPKLTPESSTGAIAGKPETKGGDTGGCSICPKRGTIFIQIPNRVRTQVLNVRVHIGSAVRLVADEEGLEATQKTGRVDLLLPFELAELDLSKPNWLVQVELEATWIAPKKMSECSRGHQ